MKKGNGGDITESSGKTDRDKKEVVIKIWMAVTALVRNRQWSMSWCTVGNITKEVNNTGSQ